MTGRLTQNGVRDDGGTWTDPERFLQPLETSAQVATGGTANGW